MNIFLHCLRLSLLPVLFVLTFSASASTPAEPAVVKFSYRAGWTVDDYLTQFLTKVPLAQFESSPSGDSIRLTGAIVIELFNMPEAVQVAVENDLRRAFRGERRISGAALDIRAAEVVFLASRPEVDTPRQTYGPAEPSDRVVRHEVDMEAIKREVEDRQRLQAQERGDFGCGSFLGHIDK
ncbi:MAG: hypothetical protein KF799_09060 [Bdellovibrionales bacterium]|nr:hypothetical protein [Bdellovibrionales bacterium]